MGAVAPGSAASDATASSLALLAGTSSSRPTAKGGSLQGRTSCSRWPLGGRQVRQSCRPADRATGYLRTTTRAGSDELGGSFLVELATCKNAGAGEAVEWPPAPRAVPGSFDGPPHGPSPQ